MLRMDFKIEGGSINPDEDFAALSADELLIDALREAVLESIGLDVEVTVGGITMPLAIWSDPDHWSDEWAQHAGDEDAADFVDRHLREAVR